MRSNTQNQVATKTRVILYHLMDLQVKALIELFRLL